MNIKLKVKDIDPVTFQVRIIGEKTIATPEQRASKWVREELKGVKTADAPQLSSHYGVKQEGRGSLVPGAFGYLQSAGNNVYKNGTGVSITSSAFSNANGLSIIPANLRKVVALFTARKTIVPNWVNCKDEYMPPNQEHPEYTKWNNDAFVYSLFNPSSQQSSLRDITYKGVQHNILNQFFYMSHNELSQLANQHSFNELYQDAKRCPGERHVYELLRTMHLSDDAKAVLEGGRDLLRKALPLRKLYHEAHPEYHLQAWDAGHAQHKPLYKEHFKADHDAFCKLYKAFEVRMREGVFKFGFLYP